MAQPLPRYRPEEPVERRVARILVLVGEPAPAAALVQASAAGGDSAQLRGLPAVGPGCGSGAMAGTDPLAALLAKEERAGRGN